MASSSSSNPWPSLQLRPIKKALFAAGIPATSFITNDINSEYHRLKALGVRFRGEPKNIGPIIAVLFEDTCGNLINLAQPVV